MVKESQDADLVEECNVMEADPYSTYEIRHLQIENAKKKLNALEKAYDQCVDEVSFPSALVIGKNGEAG